MNYQWVTLGRMDYAGHGKCCHIPSAESKLTGISGICIIFFSALAFLFFMRGDCIQAIVMEKSGVTDIRAATVVDLIYAILL